MQQLPCLSPFRLIPLDPARSHSGTEAVAASTLPHHAAAAPGRATRLPAEQGAASLGQSGGRTQRACGHSGGAWVFPESISQVIQIVKLLTFPIPQFLNSQFAISQITRFSYSQMHDFK